MKKLLLFILLPLLGMAQNFTVGGINYTVTSSTEPLTVKVGNNSGFSGAAVIPETVTDPTTSLIYSVTSIENDAFNYCSSLTSVSIGNSVTSIGNAAFIGCANLTSVTIGNSVTSIGNFAFRNCTNLTLVTIPNSVTSIGDFAFYACSNLTSVTIGSSVASIGDSAFSGCTNLTLVTIPNSVTSIGNSAFSVCTNLTSVTIGNSVASIGGYTFNGCTHLTSVTIGSSVASIGDSAFSGCTILTSVTIPNSVTSIENFAFYTCSNLTSVTIGSSVAYIRGYAFFNCPNLTSVTALRPTPIVIDGSVFGGTTNQANCDLYTIDATSQALYQATSVWQNFRTVLGSESFVEANFKMYPNPTSEILTIELQSGLELQNVNFYNTLGQLVKTSQKTTTNVSELAKGNYFVEVITNEGKATKTVIIQ